MASREQAQRRHEHDPEPDPPADPPPAAQAGAQQRDEETDALLDEIDGVLETNAQDFVHSFVQKGGQ
ncbi:MAG: ubiquitin-like protein Pup [Ornithinimicrobium sp.]